MNELVSVIIPVYNTSLYIEKCIDSVFSQTLKNIEVIAVNDGSKDDSLTILHKLKTKYPSMKIIDKKNTGVSDTRNVGIKASTGSYILFVDSDDYIEKDMIEIMLEKAIETKADIVRCNANIFNVSGGITHENLAYFSNKLFSTKDDVIYKRFFTDIDALNCYTPLLLINKKVIVNFDTSLVFIEDIDFYLRLFLNSSSVYFLDMNLYNYQYNTNSSSKKISNVENNIESAIRTVKKLSDTINNNAIKIDECSYNNRYFKLIMQKLELLPKYGKIKNIYEVFNNEIINDYFMSIELSNISKVKKIQLYLIKHNKYKLFYLFTKLKLKLRKYVKHEK
mgnify:CR=1 FL=1